LATKEVNGYSGIIRLPRLLCVAKKVIGC